MATEPIRSDIAIIGAGPVGLFAVFQAGMLEMKTVVIDSIDAAGGQCTALYPEKPIFDIPAYPRIQASELVERLTEQAAPFEPKYLLGEQVVGLTEREGGWRLTTSEGTEIDVTAVIIAAGCGAFGPNKPPLARLGEFEETSVFYLVTRREDFRNKRVVIAGGGDSAVDWTLSLADVARRIMVVHRRDRFRAAPESVRRLHELARSGAIDLVVPYQLHGLEGEDGQLSAVVVRDLDGNERALQADVLLPFYGLSMNLGPILDWELAIDRNHVRVDPATCATDRKGIFAIGDITTYPGKLKLILSGFSEAAMACHAIHSLVHPDKVLHFEYSTTKGVPGNEGA
jgi:thioredoxin reductase (NADPH)